MDRTQMASPKRSAKRPPREDTSTPQTTGEFVNSNKPGISGKSDLPEGVVRLSDILAAIFAALPQPIPTVPRLTYRQEELAEALGISDRTFERERSAGRFPKPDLHIGKIPLWRPETVKAWLSSGGK